MEIFIDNLPRRVGQNDLLQFFKGYYKRNGIRIRIVDEETEAGEHHHYAIVDIDHERLAAKALKKLNGQSLGGYALRLREYQHRNYGNERRALGWRNRAWSGVERRKIDRRLKVKVEANKADELFDAPAAEEEAKKDDIDSIKISAYEGMARKF